MKKKEIATKEDLHKVLTMFEATGIRYWLDGGWGVDVLAGKQTREHRDIDINFDSHYMDQLLTVLKKHGYDITTDVRPIRLELYHPQFSYIDIYPFQLAKDGTAKQADLEGGWYEFPVDLFGEAEFDGRMIPCISLKGQKLFHTGYEPREVDIHDIEILEGIEK